MEIADGVFRLGTKWANFYVIEQRAAITIIDSGFPGYASSFTDLLQKIGRTPTDVRALVLSHYHSDHLGSAGWIREVSGARVLISRVDLPYATGEKKPKTPNFLPLLRYPKIYSYLGHAARNGGLAMPRLLGAEPFEDEERLDVPGDLRVIHTPGHTPGHCSFYSQALNVLFAGDALLTTDVRRFSGPPGVMPQALNTDQGQAIASLDRLDEVDAPLVLPGHGEPWTAGVREAVRLARQSLLAKR